jgi:hypothetical protein
MQQVNKLPLPYTDAEYSLVCQGHLPATGAVGPRRNKVQVSFSAVGAGSMLYFLVKCTLSGIIIAVVSEIAKRSPAFGAVVASLPLVSLLAFLWLWRDTGDTERIAELAETTFWYVLPSLPMFLVMPAMLRVGMGFWISFVASCALTVVLYLLTAWVLQKFGLNI